MSRETVPPREPARPLSVRWVVAGACLVAAAYTTVFLIVGVGGLPAALAGGVANTLPVVLLGLAARGLIIRHVLGRSPVRTAVGHVRPDVQINYGTGRDVSDESIADAVAPLTVRFLPGGYLELGTRAGP